MLLDISTGPATAATAPLPPAIAIRAPTLSFSRLGRGAGGFFSTGLGGGGAAAVTGLAAARGAGAGSDFLTGAAFPLAAGDGPPPPPGWVGTLAPAFTTRNSWALLSSFVLGSK